MARFFDPTYDSRQFSGSSGVEVSDLRPEQSRDVDLRRLDPEERDSFSDRFRTFGYERNQEDAQDRISSYMKAARTAGVYRQRAQTSEPQLRGRTPRNEATLDGVTLPSQGDSGGKAGTTGYARKPQPSAGRFYGFS
jgi:hypothetical protein